MGKNKKKKNVASAYGETGGTRYNPINKSNNHQNSPNGGEKKQVRDVTYGPVAVLLYEEMKYQIETYLAAYRAEPKGAAKDLFQVGAYPAVIQSEDGIADQYDIYQLERNVRPCKDNESILQAPSTAILAIDRETGRPAFFVKAFMMTKDNAYTGARVTVYEYDDRGNDYRKSLRASFDMVNWKKN